jgi:hypothetical protein
MAAEMRYESIHADHQSEGQASRADEEARWDADANFWRLDSWSEADLCDNRRFGHYLANVAKHDPSKVGGSGK